MVTATKSAHKRELGAHLGNGTGHGLPRVLDTEKRSSKACRFEQALQERIVGRKGRCKRL
jgi:hypothetical protein